MLYTRLRVDLTRGRMSCTRRCVRLSSPCSIPIHLPRRRLFGSLAGLSSCGTTLTTSLLCFGFHYMLSSLILISVFWFFPVCCLSFCPPLAGTCGVQLLFSVYCFSVFVFYFFVFSVLVLLMSVAMVVLSRFSFAVVVISSSNSKIFHAAIKCLSSAATFGEGHAASQAVDVCSFIFLFSFSVLVLLLSVTMVVLIRYSFAVVVISSSNSKIFHAAIKCLSSAATSGEGHAASQVVVVCYFVFLFSSGYCLCSALFCVHAVDGPLLRRHSEKHSQP
jgi:hypothetical protein